MTNSGELLQNEVIIVKGWYITRLSNTVDDRLETEFVDMRQSWSVPSHETPGKFSPSFASRKRTPTKNLLVDLQWDFIRTNQIEEVNVTSPHTVWIGGVASQELKEIFQFL